MSGFFFSNTSSGAPSGGYHFEDDEQLTFGNTDASPDVTMEWDTDVAPNKFIATQNGAGDFDWRLGDNDGTSSFVIRQSDENQMFNVDSLGTVTFSQQASTSGVPNHIVFSGGTHTGLTAATEVTNVLFNFNTTKTWATGAIGLQREMRVRIPTYNAAAASTMTDAGTFAIDGMPLSGANMTIDSSTALLVGNATSYLGDANNIVGITNFQPGIADSVGNVTNLYGFHGTGNGPSVSLGDQTANLTNLALMTLEPVTYVSDTGKTRTVTSDVATLLLQGPPIDGANVSFTDTAYTLKVVSGSSYFGGGVLFENGGTDAITIDATTTPLTQTNGAINMDVATTTASATGINAVTTLTGDVDLVTTIFAGVVGNASGSSSGNTTYAVIGQVFPSTNDSDHNYVSFRASVASAIGTNTRVAYEVSEDFDKAFVAESGTIQGAKGTDLASATDMAAPNGNYVDVTGGTTIDTMATTNIQAGTFITLQFDASPTVRHNTAGGGASFLLSGASNYNAGANDTLTVVYDGTTWREVARTVI